MIDRLIRRSTGFFLTAIASPRQLVLPDGQDELFSDKDDGQLETDLHVTAARSALLLPVAQQAIVVTGMANGLALSKKR